MNPNRQLFWFSFETLYLYIANYCNMYERERVKPSCSMWTRFGYNMENRL